MAAFSELIYLAQGDSITAGTDAGLQGANTISYASYIAQGLINLYTTLYFNRACGGATILISDAPYLGTGGNINNAIQYRVPYDIASLPPVSRLGNRKLLITLMGGTNNEWESVSGVTVSTNSKMNADFAGYMAICDQYKASYPSCKIVVFTMLPGGTGVGVGFDTVFEQMRQNWNTNLRAQVGVHFDKLADCGNDPQMGQGNQGGQFNNPTYFLSAVHPTDAGQRLIASRWGLPACLAALN